MFLLILGLFKGFWGFSEALRCHAPGEKATDQRKILDLGSQNIYYNKACAGKGQAPACLPFLAALGGGGSQRRWGAACVCWGPGWLSVCCQYRRIRKVGQPSPCPLPVRRVGRILLQAHAHSLGSPMFWVESITNVWTVWWLVIDWIYSICRKYWRMSHNIL